MKAVALALRFLTIPVLAGASFAQSIEQPNSGTPEGIAFFEKNVRPILAGRCYGCHNSTLPKPMGGLVLDSRAGTLRGGQSGVPAVLPGKPEESLLVKAIRGTNQNLKMPAGGKALEPREIDNLVAWIGMGAPDPRVEENPKKPAQTESYDWAKARQHWAFQPVRSTEPPRVASPEWNGSPVDRFIKAKLDENGLTPLARSGKLALLRRMTYDLTGLPPTPQEVSAFLADTSTGAVEKVVDRLLASPQYGAQWGRHWLDVVRYADTSGNSPDFPVPAMYRYRNWVIQAFNEDKPYDQFLREQIAGDILAAEDKKDWQQKLVATGYLANSRRFAAVMADYHLTLDDTIDALGRGILGLTIGCARCHDHKFDPIPTADYYALYGIFQSSDYSFPGTETHPQAARSLSTGSEQEAKKLKEFETGFYDTYNSLDRFRLALISGKVVADEANIRADADARLRKLRAQAAEFYAAKAHAVYGVNEGTPVNARMFIKGDPEMPGPEVPRGFLTILGGRKVPPEEKGSGRRELADWVADAQNPLTARVMVNRIWGWHFGQGIVATPDDFGKRGAPPSHPELLDYLTTRFIESGWSVKKMHRLILLSRAYQTAAGYDARSAAKDPRNAFLWKFNARRLMAEEIRDSMLMVSGKLDGSMGGPHPFPPELDWKFTQHKPFLAVYEDNKRSVYRMQQRQRKDPYLELFDGADTGAVTGLRPVTTTALQALFTMNNPFVIEQSDSLAVRVGMAYSTTGERLGYACKLLFGRSPTAEESSGAVRFLADARRALDKTTVPEDQRNRKAWGGLMQVLFSSNEFLFLE